MRGFLHEDGAEEPVAQGLVQEGGKKIANWVWSASFMLVSSCHKTNLMTNLDADHLHITCVELYVIVHVPNGLPLGFLRTTALAPPPRPLACIVKPPIFSKQQQQQQQQAV